MRYTTLTTRSIWIWIVATLETTNVLAVSLRLSFSLTRRPRRFDPRIKLRILPSEQMTSSSFWISWRPLDWNILDYTIPEKVRITHSSRSAKLNLSSSGIDSSLFTRSPRLSERRTTSSRRRMTFALLSCIVYIKTKLVWLRYVSLNIAYFNHSQYPIQPSSYALQRGKHIGAILNECNSLAHGGSWRINYDLNLPWPWRPLDRRRCIRSGLWPASKTHTPWQALDQSHSWLRTESADGSLDQDELGINEPLLQSTCLSLLFIPSQSPKQEYRIRFAPMNEAAVHHGEWEHGAVI